MEATAHPAAARWAGTHQVLMNWGKEGRPVVVGMLQLLCLLHVGGDQSSWSYGGSGGYDEQWLNQQSPWRRQSGELTFPLYPISLSLLPLLYPLLFSCLT